MCEVQLSEIQLSGIQYPSSRILNTSQYYFLVDTGVAYSSA